MQRPDGCPICNSGVTEGHVCARGYEKTWQVGSFPVCADEGCENEGDSDGSCEIHYGPRQ